MTETKGYFGQFGGSFVPEPIQNLLDQLEATFEQYKNCLLYTSDAADDLQPV